VEAENAKEVKAAPEPPNTSPTPLTLRNHINPISSQATKEEPTLTNRDIYGPFLAPLVIYIIGITGLLWWFTHETKRSLGAVPFSSREG